MAPERQASPLSQRERLDVLIVGAEWHGERPGGLNRYVASLVPALLDAGVACGAVVLADGPLPSGFASGGRRGDGLLSRALAMRRAVAGSASSVLDVHFALYAFLPLATAGPRRRRPLVVHFHGPWAQEALVAKGSSSRLGSWLRRAVETYVYRRAQSVIVLSHAFADVVTDTYGVRRENVHVVPPGVDLRRFSPAAQGLSRHRLGLPPERFVAVAARRLDARMGLDLLLYAWEHVSRMLPDPVLVIAGEGRERVRLEERIATLSCRENVRLVGRVSDDKLVDLYRSADCSVVPSRELEGFGLVTLEALACGTPAIVTNVGGLPDGVVGLDPSLVVPAGDAAELGRRLVALATGEGPSRSACRAHAERFTWEAAAARHRAIYEAVQG